MMKYFLTLLNLTPLVIMAVFATILLTYPFKLNYEKACIDGVQYLRLSQGLHVYLTPHFKDNGKVYLCHDASKMLNTQRKKGKTSA